MKSTRISQVYFEAGQSASLPTHHALKSLVRRAGRIVPMAAILALLLVPAIQSKAQAIEPEYIPLNAEQLDQLVAPISLDPDPLVAQILIGATFPDQVGDADNWLTSKLTLSADQRAASASSMSWDPSIKGLVVFPVVLDSMAKNSAWTVQLGNAYYNQPDDVMDAIQAMRLAAFQTHYLVATVQQNVEVTDDLIEILPANPNVVYVEYYNPWRVWGTLVDAYPDYVVEPVPAGVEVADGVSFEPAVSVGLDAHFGFSFGGWAPGWDGGAVVYNNNVYNSNSRTVANHGHYGGRDCRAFQHGGRGVPAGFHPGHGRDGSHNSIARSMPERGTNSRFGSVSRPGAGARSSMANRSYAQNHATSRGINPRSTAMSHTTSPSRSMASNRSNANRPSTNRPGTNRSLANNSNAGRNSASSRQTSYGRSTATRQPASTGNRFGQNPGTANRSMNQSASGAHAPAANRPVTQNRPSAPSSSMNRPAPAARSMASSPSTPRPGAGSSMAANRPVNRPAPESNSFGSNQAMNHPAAKPFGGGQPANRGGSFGHGGAGFGGAHVGGGGKH